MAETPGRAFYDRQIAYLQAGDIDGLIANQYTADAVLVLFDRTIRGKAALHAHFVGYLAMLGSLKLKSTDKFAETEDSIFFEATMLTAHNQARVYDVFMLRDGKATHHFSGLLGLDPLPES